MKTQNGFTLVEIMIVVVIIGLLASMAIPAFQKVRINSQDKAVLNNARQLSGASDQYYLENGVSRCGLRPLGPTSYIKALNSVANETIRLPSPRASRSPSPMSQVSARSRIRPDLV